MKDPVQKLALVLATALVDILDVEKPLSPGLDPDHRSGPPALYHIRPGHCPRCGGKDPKSALLWQEQARCRECMRRLGAS